MTNKRRAWFFKGSGILALIVLLTDLPAPGQNTPSPKQLVDFAREPASAILEPASGMKVRLARSEKVGLLRIEADGRAGADDSVTIKAPSGYWDLASYLAIAMDVRNSGAAEILVTCSVDDSKWEDGAVFVPSGETRTLQILLKRKSPPEQLKDRLFGMNGLPGGFVGIWESADPGHISKLHINLGEHEGKTVIEIRNLRAEGAYSPPPAETLFPFVDAFGQYKGASWPGKIQSLEDFARRRSTENEDILKNPPPDEWDRYGGWNAGPLLAATGRFRTEKYHGKWWLVDPEGRLFWSHGIDCVRVGEATPISGRERYFEKLPDPSGPMGAFYGEGLHAAKGYYRDHSPYKTYDFARANLLRKYGDEWQRLAVEIPHRRLRSWGMNTIGNWSDESVYLLQRTPYVVNINARRPPIQGSEGHWGQFPDPFAPEFRQALIERLGREKGKSAGDPWCIGYFVDNELTWGDETMLARAVLASPSSQPAKRVFLEDLKSKFSGIEALNAKWGAHYSSWQEVLDGRAVPEAGKAADELAAFNARIADEYFRAIEGAIQEVTPGTLYLGCRFDFHFYPTDQRSNDWLIRIAAKHCDVVSFNRYRFTASDLVPQEGVDKPLIIGEFHFGALDRGMLHTGLRSVADQQERGELYRSYVIGALLNPYLVGTHWFQYQDQPVTGRSDGENYQIGFVDVADTPYPEIVQASRAIAVEIYRLRASR